MGIVTGAGDKGKTFLFKGGRVSKDDVRVEACGAIDKVCAYLGMAKSLIKDKKGRNKIEEEQRRLFSAGAEISAGCGQAKNIKKKISEEDISRLDNNINSLESKGVFDKKCFCLSGENICSAVLDVARTAVREAERRVVPLYRKKFLKNRFILVYLNRLSDYLYLLSRRYEKRSNAL